MDVSSAKRTPIALGLIIVCAAIGLRTIGRSSAADSLLTPRFNGRIAFYSTRHNRAFDIYSINPDGSSPLRLTDDQGYSSPIGPVVNMPSYDNGPSWSPDGGRIAFVSNRDPSGFQIYTMNVDGTSVRRLTNDVANAEEPAWSPDGSKLAFTRGSGCAVVGVKNTTHTAADDPCIPYIYVMNADGSNPANVSRISGRGAVWSPDGSRIAFTSSENSLTRIYSMNADGSNLVQISSSPSNDSLSSWSPDGKRLAFSSDRNSPNDSFINEIYTMSVDGTGVVRLTTKQANDSFPVYSPDGTQIAFQRGIASFNEDPAQNAEIYVMNADGTDQRNVTNNKADDFGPPAWQTLSSPVQLPPPAVLQFSSSTYEVNEGARGVELTVNRSGNLTEDTSVEIDTNDGSAQERSDYTRLFARLHFASGETRKTLRVLITDDGFTEPAETFTAFLHDLTGNASLASSGSSTVSIIDNDPQTASTNPLDDSGFFVRQQYHDFLSREPDDAGFAYWVNNIEACGNDSACRQGKKIDTSAAFFLSTEFQQTVFYVFCVYNEYYKSPTYQDLIRDAQDIGRGLVVGEPGWEQRLDINTERVTEDIVSRTGFLQNYPDGMTASDFVDRLYARQGSFVPPPGDERAQAIEAFGAGDLSGRARALRIVAKNKSFQDRLFNQAFVFTEYAGYLRRDPDYQGLTFWTNKLNKFNGDFRAAEMVKAFLSSQEYRSRFGM